MHGDSCFVTLTYDQANAPKDGSLEPKEFQKWLKRLRKEWPNKLRYFGVGEYGDETWRPHYHVALFGFPVCERGRTEHRLKVCCSRCELLKRTWGKGGIDCGTLTLESCQYVAGYVTKKMTFAADPRLRGRAAEFARMSLRGGIGVGAVPTIASAIANAPGAFAQSFDGGVPTTLRHGRRELPVGRYLRSRLRDTLNLPTSSFVDSMERRMREVQALSHVVGTVAAVASLNLEPEEARIASLKAKQKIYRKKESL